jgi:hypothetical protein
VKSSIKNLSLFYRDIATVGVIALLALPDSEPPLPLHAVLRYVPSQFCIKQTGVGLCSC